MDPRGGRPVASGLVLLWGAADGLMGPQARVCTGQHSAGQCGLCFTYAIQCWRGSERKEVTEPILLPLGKGAEGCRTTPGPAGKSADPGLEGTSHSLLPPVHTPNGRQVTLECACPVGPLPSEDFQFILY